MRKNRFSAIISAYTHTFIPMRRIILPIAGLVLTFATVTVVHGFFSQIDEMKAELTGWQSAHAADFSDLLSTLDNLSGGSFNDVSDADWFSPYVATVSGWGVVSGYKDAQGNALGTFGPANPVTVAELLKMAFKSDQIDTSVCGLVPPVHAQAIGHWAQAYISCGEQMNIRILKDPSLTIDRHATRAEVLAVLDDVFGEHVPPLFSNFKDTQGHPLEADIAYAYTRGIVSGDKDSKGIETGIFRPNDDINRAEVAKIIYEWTKVRVKEGATTKA